MKDLHILIHEHRFGADVHLFKSKKERHCRIDHENYNEKQRIDDILSTIGVDFKRRKEECITIYPVGGDPVAEIS